MTARDRAALAALLALAAVLRAPLAAARPRVTVLDDGVRVSRDVARPLEESPWPAGPIELVALRGETLALQVVIEAGRAAVEDARVVIEPLMAEGGGRLGGRVETFVERFIVIERPTGNDRSPGSLAFTEKARPAPPFTGAIADPLVPAALEKASARPHERAVVWIDLSVPDVARPGLYRSALLVRDARGELDARPLELRVLDATLPYAAASAFVFYGPDELERRMGDARAERGLRELLHAHRLGAIRPLVQSSLSDPATLDFERSAVLGTAYTRDRGYEGPGQGRGEAVLALGTYGSLGEPSPGGRDVAARLARAVLGDGAGPARPDAFLYAVDEACASDWPARWIALLRASDALRHVRVGATCGDEPSTQAAELVMQTAPDFDPARARVAERASGKWVWAYNGQRPWAGPMMLDVPATDLRANAWIAMRYGVPRWFYWQSTAWFDDSRGGRGGERGFDPFVVAETFHNADGDHADGDGILLYPGSQRTSGMVDYGAAEVFPSVRLKNLRRGIEDAGYIALARARDPDRANAIVRRMVPRALARAGDRPAWPQRARPWLEARLALAELLSSGVDRAARSADAPSSARADPSTPEVVSESCSIARSRAPRPSAPPWLALFLWGAIVATARARRSRLLRTE